MIFVIGLLLAISLFVILKRRQHRVHVPPGPPAYPLIGNLLSIPRERFWIVFAEWRKQYGSIMSFRILTQNIIVLNSYEAACTLLARHSNRLHVPMAGALVGWGRTTGFLPSGSVHRIHRRLIRKMLSADVLMEQEAAGQRLVDNLRHRTTNPRECIEHEINTLMLHLIYGYTLGSGEDHYTKIVKRAMEGLVQSATPGAFLVDVFPLLRHLPTFFPGSAFKTHAEQWKASLDEMASIPFDRAKVSVDGKSFVNTLLSSESSEEYGEIKWAAISVYTGAFETTLATIDAFLLAMLLYPDVQSRAQAELDHALTGSIKVDDRARLPYIDALCKEVHRIHSVIPCGIGHLTDKSDMYEGYHIPPGSLILANQWLMAHDPDVYHEPMTFDPTRFLGEHKERDPRDIVFGFGRRACPGRALADTSVFIVAASILQHFNILPVEGEPLPNWDTIHGLVCHISPFRYLLTPRTYAGPDRHVI